MLAKTIVGLYVRCAEIGREGRGKGIALKQHWQYRETRRGVVVVAVVSSR